MKPTLQSIAIQRPDPTRRKRQNLCADKGYDYPEIRELVLNWGYTAHIKGRGDEEADPKGFSDRLLVDRVSLTSLRDTRRMLSDPPV